MSKGPQVKDLPSIKENIEQMRGIRGSKCDLAGLKSIQISNPPTQAQVEFLRAQLANLVERLEGTS